MIISNPSQKPELDRKAIITLGDSLHNRGDLFAAQFCYLMAKVEFSRYSDVKPDTSVILNIAANAVRLILLGASCHKNFAEFATDEAIIMTEIYEYACALSNDSYSIVEFQPYKFLLGTRMLDYGFHLKSLMYMEQVAAHIQKNPSRYERSFVERVYAMADQLKYYDPVLEKNLDNITDDDAVQSPTGNQQQWQQDLLSLLHQLPVNSSEEILDIVSMVKINSEFVCSQSQATYYNDISPQQAAHLDDPYAQADAAASQIDKEFVQINQQFSDLNLQYQQQSTMPATGPASLDYGVNSYGSAAQQAASEMHSLPNNYGESETVADAYQQQSHGGNYDDQQQQQQHQYHSNYYQPGSNDVPHYDQQSQIYQPQSLDSHNSMSYGDPNYLNSEVNSHFIHFSFNSFPIQDQQNQIHASISFYFHVMISQRCSLYCDFGPALFGLRSTI